MINRPFDAKASTFSVAVTSTATTAKSMSLTPQAMETTIRLVNEGPNRCYIAVGGSAVVATVPDGTTATATCTPVLGGEDIVLCNLQPGDTHISAVSRSNETATLIVSIGGGN